MKNILVLFRKDWEELSHSPAFRVICILYILLGLGLSLLFKGISMSVYPLETSLMQFLLSAGTYSMAFLPAMTLIWTFAPTLITREKSSGTLEVLLAGPLTPQELLISKGILIILPAWILGLISMIPGVLTLAALASDLPGTLFSLSIFINALILVPLMFLLLTVLMVLITSVNNGDLAILPSFVIGFGIMILVPLGQESGFFKLQDWSFTWFNLAVLGVLFILTLIFSRGLDKEKIVQSRIEE